VKKPVKSGYLFLFHGINNKGALLKSFSLLNSIIFKSLEPMANTFSQMYVQVVFAVKYRQHLIPKSRKEELHKYITGIVRNRKQKMIRINCMPDHSHLFIGFKPTIAISDLVRDIKTASSTFLKEQSWMKYDFNWQDGYGAFTYHHSQIDQICKYIMKQEEHHRTKTFKQEYLELLDEFEVPYEERYLFDWID
jgi:putative transposase